MNGFVFTGRHRFRALGTLVLAAQLAACGGGDGGSKVPSPSGGSNPPPPVSTKHKLTLQGTVTDEPIANANVTATVGSQSFSATADAAGNYSLNLEVDDTGLTQPIQLVAKGVGEQAHVEFISLAGSVQALTAAAGADGILSSTENFATQITNVSTAQAALIAAANGGELPTSVAALQTLATSINAQDVLDLAAAIKLAVDDAANYPLPTGHTSILTLVSDATARQQFLNATYEKDPAAFAAVQAAIVQDAGLTKPISIDEDRSITTALLSSEADFSFNYSGRVMHFDFNKDGSGWAISETFDQPMTWVIEGSTVRVTYTSPVTTESADMVNCNGNVQQYIGQYVSNGATVAFLNEQTVAITTKSNVSYPGCPALAPREDISTVARTVLSLDHFQTIDAAELSGATQTIYAYDSARQRVLADIADLGTDGTGTTRLMNLSFTWQLDETGKIVQVQFTDGTTAEYLSFGPIGGSDPLASDLFWEIRTPGDGPVYMGAGASVFADPQYAVDLAVEDVPGRFYQFGIGNEAGGDARLKGFRLRFDANFLGAQEDDHIDELGNRVTMDEIARPSDAFRWSLEGGDVVVRRTADAALGTFNCVLGASAGCVLFDERRITPLAADGTRIYWIEQRRLNPMGITASTPATHLVRFYDYEPLSGAALSGSAKPRLITQTSQARALLRGAQLR